MADDFAKAFEEYLTGDIESPEAKALKKIKDRGLTVKSKPFVDSSGLKGNDYMLLDKAGNRVGEFPVDFPDEYKNIKTAKPTGTFVTEAARGKGITTDMYKFIEAANDAKIIPDDVQSYDGSSLHNKRGLGKDFGISEELYDSKLTPEEKLQRNARKKIVSDSINEYADSLEKGTPKSRIELMVDADKKASKVGGSKNVSDVIRHAVRKPKGKQLSIKALKRLAKDPKFLSKVRSPAAMTGLIGAQMGVMGEGVANKLHQVDQATGGKEIDQAVRALENKRFIDLDKKEEKSKEELERLYQEKVKRGLAI